MSETWRDDVVNQIHEGNAIPSGVPDGVDAKGQTFKDYNAVGTSSRNQKMKQFSEYEEKEGLRLTTSQ